MRRWDWIDWLLLLAAGVAAVMLVISLSWPTLEAWWLRPRPGIEMPQQFFGTIGEEDFERSIRVDYLMYLPEEFDDDKSWPLMVYLHGSGARGNDIEKVRQGGGLPGLVEQGYDFPFVMISPQCPEGMGWEPERLLALIEHICSNWPIDRERIYLIGWSMGGFGTWQTAAAEPDRFAAIVPIAGGGNTADAERLVGLPIWAFHGANDESVPLKACTDMIEAVRAAGGHPKLTIFKQLGHGIPAKTIAKEDFWNWLLSQRRDNGIGQDNGHDQAERSD